MTATEMATRISRNAWDWDIFKFARAIGRDPATAQKDMYVVEKWKAFKALDESLKVLGPLVEQLAV